MKIYEELLTTNKYSRPGAKMNGVKAVVLHWVANPGQSAMGVRNYFDQLKNQTGPGRKRYSSAHYITDIDGTIIQCIPESEISYNCGSSEYTHFAETLFGTRATSANYSPNYHTIAIELCHPDKTGEFTDDTFFSAVNLTADICRRENIEPAYQITTHKNIVGWKDCPKWWVDNPSELQRFIYSVERMID
jgi:N-acetylmuramoyl-L-alanine amidase